MNWMEFSDPAVRTRSKLPDKLWKILDFHKDLTFTQQLFVECLDDL